MNGLYPLLLEHLAEARVTQEGAAFRVDFGPRTPSPIHLVQANRICTCDLGPGCPAVLAVIEQLERDPPASSYYLHAPPSCPVCGAKAYFDRTLSSRCRGAGWRCAEAGAGHYWLDQVLALQARFAANPWLFPPAVVREGAWVLAWDGVQPQDQVLYPGLRREDVWTEPCLP